MLSADHADAGGDVGRASREKRKVATVVLSTPVGFVVDESRGDREGRFAHDKPGPAQRVTADIERAPPPTSGRRRMLSGDPWNV